MSLTTVGLAQTQEQAADQFSEFSKARTIGIPEEIIAEGEKLIPMVDKLTPRRQAITYFYLANAYEQAGQIEKGVPYYKKVIELEPDYYVTYRALGYYHLKESDGYATKLNASKDPAERDKLMDSYKDALLQALAYLEKDYACDPFDESLETINRTMKSIGADAKPEEFEQRIAKLAEKCADLLVDGGP